MKDIFIVLLPFIIALSFLVCGILLLNESSFNRGVDAGIQEGWKRCGYELMGYDLVYIPKSYHEYIQLRKTLKEYEAIFIPQDVQLNSDDGKAWVRGRQGGGIITILTIRNCTFYGGLL